MMDPARLARLSAAQRRVLADRLGGGRLPGRGAGPRLVAWVQASPAGRPEPAELRRHLAAQLPDYMIPAEFVFVESWPRLPSGKLDRQALRALDHPAAPVAEATFEPPTNDLERGIARIWCELLGCDRVGVRDNFFDLGGHSLLLVRVQSRLRDTLGLDVTVMDLFRYPTIQAIADATRTQGTRPLAATNWRDAAEERVLKHREALRRYPPPKKGS